MSVPDWLRNLPTLTELSLSDNPLTSIPEWLRSLTTLTQLAQPNNRLTTLPESLGTCHPHPAGIWPAIS